MRGVSTRKVDELVKALGMGGISKSRVSELCEELDEEVERFRGRPLEGPYPYVWVDATYLKSRQDGHVASTAVVIAVGVNAKTGEREVLGLDVGPSEDGAFWSSFLRSLVARGLSGVLGWSPATPTEDSRAPSKRSCMEHPGSAAGCTS